MSMSMSCLCLYLCTTLCVYACVSISVRIIVYIAYQCVSLSTVKVRSRCLHLMSRPMSLSVCFPVCLLGILLRIFYWCSINSNLPFSSAAEFKYHAFISFQKEDSHWVSGELLPFLEKEHQIQCCLHYRDFDPGTPFLESMADGVYKSYKIIVVFSSNFLQSNYCIHELDLAQYRLLNRRDDSLIIIRIDNTDPSKLPPALQKRNFIDYSDVLERPFWKSKLLKFLNSGSQSVSTDTDNNNSSLEESNEQNGNRQARAGFDRLNSTISTATEISIVSLNEERLI